MKKLTPNNSKTMKELNRKTILNVIKNNYQISKSDIQKITGLSAPTVGTIIDELIEEGLLTIDGMGKSNGGRKPSIVGLNYKGRYAMTLLIKANGTIVSSVVNLRNEIVYEEVYKNLLTPQVSIGEVIKNTLLSTVKNSNTSMDEIVGIGISLPGILDEQMDTVLYSTYLNLNNVNLKEMVKEFMSKPVYIQKDANSMIIGEVIKNPELKEKSVIYVLADIGIGMAAMINGKLFKSNNGSCLEFGHIYIANNNKVCTCGRKGCLANLTNEQAIVDRYKELVNSGRTTIFDQDQLSSLNFDQIAKAQKENDGTAIQALIEAGDYLGIGLANVVQLFNPDLIVAGGSLITTNDYLYNSMISSIKSRTFKYYFDNLKILKSDHSYRSEVLGMASKVLSKEVFDKVN